MPRPKKENKKGCKMTVRFTNHDKVIIKQKAMLCGLNEAEYIRRSCTNKVIKPRLTENEIEFYRHLVGISNNLNQIARHFNQGEKPLKDLMEIIKAINNGIKKLA
jgi:hypothetical protein